jgi:hypothetical protein
MWNSSNHHCENLKSKNKQPAFVIPSPELQLKDEHTAASIEYNTVVAGAMSLAP